MASEDDNCEHGKWVDGICKCEEGYVTEFTNEELYPKYCTKKYENVPLKLKGNEIHDFFNYLAISATLLLFISSIMVFAYFWYTVIDSWVLGLRIAEAKRKLEKFKSSVIRRGADEDLRAEIWYPDMDEYICVNDPSFTIEKAVMAEMEKMRILCAKVTHEYKPKKTEELKLEVGDIITNVVKLKSGWCKGKLDGKSGYFAEAYVQMFETMAGEDGKPILSMADYMVQSQYYDSARQSAYYDSARPSMAGETLMASLAGETVAGPDKSNLLRTALSNYIEQDKQQLVQYWQQGVKDSGRQSPGLGGWQSPGAGGWQSPGAGGWQSPGAGGWQSPGAGGWQSPGLGGWQSPGFGGGQFPGLGGWQSPGAGGGQFPGVVEHVDGYDYDKVMGAGENWYYTEDPTQNKNQPTDAHGDQAKQDHHGNGDKDQEQDRYGEAEQKHYKEKEDYGGEKEQDYNSVKDQDSDSTEEQDYLSEESQEYDTEDEQDYYSEESQDSSSENQDMETRETAKKKKS